MDQLQDDEEAVSEQEVLDDHELKVMELINCIGELIGEPSKTKTGPENELVAPQLSAPVPPSIHKEPFCRQALGIP